MKPRLILIFVLFFLIAHHFSGRESTFAFTNDDFANLESDEISIIYPPPLENAASNIERIFPVIRQELEFTLNLAVDFHTTIQLINDRRSFTRVVGSDLVVAIAIPNRNLMVIDYTRMIDNPYRLRATLKHELCHLLLHRHIDSDLLPRWLDEGVSQWVTGGLSELVTDPGWSVLENAAMRDNLFRFDELVNFPSGRSETMLAYQQSQSFIEYIVNVYGERALIEILNEMSHNVSVDRAFSQIMPHSLHEIERNWSNDIQAQVSWFTYISRNMFQFIFLFAAILVIIAFIRTLIQRRRQHDDDDDDLPLPPDER